MGLEIGPQSTAQNTSNPTPGSSIQSVNPKTDRTRERERLTKLLVPKKRADNAFRDEGFVESERQRATDIGDTSATNLRGLSGRALEAGDRGVRIGGQAQQRLGGLSNLALGQGSANRQLGQQLLQRDAPQADFGAANVNLGQATDLGQRLAALESTEGPSAAQAFLQQGLNQAQASNLALARSGRGFGQNAAALDQAVAQQAVQSQTAAGQSAILRAQEDAQRRERAATNLSAAAGIDLDTARQRIEQSEFQTQAEAQQRALGQEGVLAAAGLEQSATGQAINASAQGAGLELQGAGLGLQGVQSATVPEVAAGQAQFQGQAAAMDVTQRAADTEGADADRLLSKYGIDKGVAVQRAAQSAQRNAAIVNGFSTMVAVVATAYGGPGAGAGAKQVTQQAGTAATT